MSEIDVQGDVSYTSAYVLLTLPLLTFFSIFAVQSVGLKELAVLAAASSPPFIAFWSKFIQSQHRLKISVSTGEIAVQTVSAFLTTKRTVYALERFSSVRAYIEPGKFPKNVVELVTNAGGEALFVASFEPASLANSFLSIPTDIENPKSTQLRRAIAQVCNLTDQGFLGQRWVGAQLKD